MQQTDMKNTTDTSVYLLGIDAGGTHTDAVLLMEEPERHPSGRADVSPAGHAATALNAADATCAAHAPQASGQPEKQAAPDAAMPRMRILAAAKTPTRHDDLPASIGEVLAALATALDSDPALAAAGGAALLGRVSRVTLGATLAVNALVQDKADAVGLALSAGPGLAPGRFALGRHVCMVPGGLDHRGVEVSPLDVAELERQAAVWKEKGIAAVACVSKFSPRNPAHEQAMAGAVARAYGSALRRDAPPDRVPAAEAAAPGITVGHRLSGRLSFPRRIATAYFNAAVQRLHVSFLEAAESALARAGVSAAVRLLKADGGAVPLHLSRQEPVQSILSGPAASVMGVLALCPAACQGCGLLLDMGGTTTDMALVADGSPVVDRDGMLLQGRRTLVRALASVSIGVGGDSLISVEGSDHEAVVRVGPLRQGPAVAFGGSRPTLLDALNALHSLPCPEAESAAAKAGAAQLAGKTAGDVAASVESMGHLARRHGLAPGVLARKAVDDALARIVAAAHDLVEDINARPIYTLAGLKALRRARPLRAWLMGGPADCMGAHLAAALGMPVECPPHAAVANAVGAALTLPTDSLEVYADTGRGILRAPALDLMENIRKGYSLDALGARARELLLEKLEQGGAHGAAVEVTGAESFATLDDSGRSSRDMRVVCQAVPGLAGRVG
ncbi:hydantoinase/oxoprolinase family protein [Desulfovibrio sp.]|uniref:hydantoinase/oxoprolinase family protein n=1 Tax=Desulfovibrio sp. TaxID=885 RepID=UPI0025C4FAE8|nr:hydantoinase/oxoprolinase family protein [Desulfovibrio sp.]